MTIDLIEYPFSTSLNPGIKDLLNLILMHECVMYIVDELQNALTSAILIFKERLIFISLSNKCIAGKVLPTAPQ